MIEADESRELAKYIDHTVLYADTTRETVAKFCGEAVKHGFAAVCFNPVHVAYAKQLLKGTGVKVCTVIGFPLGASTSTVKAFEAREAVADGAQELDMVVNIGAVKDGRFDLVEQDIRAVVEAAGNAAVKVIIETCLLTDEEKIKVCQCAKAAGARFVKTSTGYSTGGATAEDVALMKRAVGENVGVKASGRVRTSELVIQMLNAGATRIGTGSGVKIVQKLMIRYGCQNVSEQAEIGIQKYYKGQQK